METVALAKDNATGRGLITWLAITWPRVKSSLDGVDIPQAVIAANRCGPRGGLRHSASGLARLAHAALILGRGVASFNDLTLDEAKKLKAVYAKEL